MRLSVIVPTVGRASLRYTLASITSQLQEGDEVLVCGDGPQPIAEIIAKRAGPQVRYMETLRPTYEWGNAQRDYAIAQASGDYLAFLDDDDQWIAHTRDKIELAVTEYIERLFLFKMRLSGYGHSPDNTVLWREAGNLELGQIGTPMFVCPNIPSRLARWIDTQDPHGYSADHHFINTTIANYPPAMLAWIPTIIADCRTA